MNYFNCYLETYCGSNIFQKNGYSFTNIAFVVIEIDFQNMFEYSGFDDAFVVYDELFKTLNEINGQYLIFTSLNGFADEGAWSGVNVRYTEESIIWKLDVADKEYRFEFNKNEYLQEIESVKKMLVNIDKNLTIEPKNVIFPYEWDNYIARELL